MNDKIVLDLETQKTFDEVGGHHNSYKLGISVCGVYSYARDQYRAFREHEFEEMLDWLKAADLIIGFNSKHFDFTVLQPYYPNFNLGQLPHLDILEEITNVLGRRLKLESVAQETLGHGKSGDGLDAIRYFRAGDWDSLITYCLDDVRVTKEVYDYGLVHGNIWYSTGGKKEKIPISWQKGESINDLLKNALRKGRQLAIDYISDDGKVVQDRIDIHKLEGDKITAFSHNCNGLKFFDLGRIKAAQDVGEMRSWQKGLF
ncbi:MAG: ribonuclease H-like domain-containing protein [Candidatus Komeilibacteria bacterium]